MRIGQRAGRPDGTLRGMQVVSSDDTRFDADVAEVRRELVVVYFRGPGCPNCDFFATRLPTLINALEGQPVRLVKFDAYAAPALATRFAVAGIPRFDLWRDGKRLGRMSEFHSDDYWLSVVREHLPA